MDGIIDACGCQKRRPSAGCLETQGIRSLLDKFFPGHAVLGLADIDRGPCSLLERDVLGIPRFLTFSRLPEMLLDTVLVPGLAPEEYLLGLGGRLQSQILRGLMDLGIFDQVLAALDYLRRLEALLKELQQ